MTKSPKPFQDHFHFKKWLTVYPSGDISKQVAKENKPFKRLDWKRDWKRERNIISEHLLHVRHCMYPFDFLS